MTDHSKYITALLVERNGYEQRGMTDRVRAVDDALREVGFDHDYMTSETTTAEPQQELASLPKARTRKKG